MNWQAKNLTTVDKERIWKEFVSKEGDKRGIYDEFHQRVTEKTRDPEIKLSPRGKRFIAKEPYGIRMEVNPATGKLEPMLTEKVTLAGGTLRSQNNSPPPPAAATANNKNNCADKSSSPNSRLGSGNATSNSTNTVRLPALPLSPSALLQQQQQQQQATNITSPTAAASNSGGGNSPTNGGGDGKHIIYGRSSPRKALEKSALQQQFLQNTFSSSTSPHHGAGTAPDASLDKSLKNLQFMATSNSVIGRGTSEVLQGMPINGGLNLASTLNSTTNTNSNNTNNGNDPHHHQNDKKNAYGDTLSGTLRSVYHTASTSPLKQRKECIPGSPRSYVIKDATGNCALFDYGRKQCDITRAHQELALRK